MGALSYSYKIRKFFLTSEDKVCKDFRIQGLSWEFETAGTNYSQRYAVKLPFKSSVRTLGRCLNKLEIG